MPQLPFTLRPTYSVNELSQPPLAASTACTLDEYQAFVDSQAGANFFHHRRWIELLRDHYGLEQVIACSRAIPSGNIVAAAAFLATKNMLGVSSLQSLPFTDTITLLGSKPGIARLSEYLNAEYGLRYGSIWVRTPQRDAVESRWVRHTVDCGPPIEAIRSRFDRRVRTNLRKAIARGLTFSTSDSPEAIEAFYALQVKTRRRLGVPVQTRRFFLDLYDRIIRRGHGFVGLVRCGNLTLAAGVFLHHNGKVVFKYSASDHSASILRPNDVLTDGGLVWAATNGMDEFDFGISRRDQLGLCRFKSKLGATTTPVIAHYISGKPTAYAEDSGLMSIASTVIRHSPDFVCKTLGSLFYRYSQ